MKKLYGLNIIKIAACILIVFHHYQQFLNCYFEGKVNFFNGNFYFGIVVELFFMCSGILAYYGYKEKGFQMPSFVEYIKNKFFRFFPMCFLSLSFLFLMQWLLFLKRGSSILWDVPTAIDYFLSIFFLDVGWGFNKFVPATHITWYISILLMAYASFWVVCWLHKNKKIDIGCVSFILIVIGAAIWMKEDDLLFKFYPVINVEFGRGLIGFYGGILTYIILENRPKIAKLFAYVGFPLVAFFMAYDYMHTNSVSSPLIGSSYLACTFILYPSIVIICLTSKVIKKISSLKFVDYIEKVTYPVYLWHINVLLIILDITTKKSIFINHGYKTMFLFTCAMFVLGACIHQFIEKPMTKFIKEKKSN